MKNVELDSLPLIPGTLRKERPARLEFLVYRFDVPDFHFILGDPSFDFFPQGTFLPGPSFPFLANPTSGSHFCDHAGLCVRYCCCQAHPRSRERTVAWSLPWSAACHSARDDEPSALGAGDCA